jgi:hypothetical protein
MGEVRKIQVQRVECSSCPDLFINLHILDAKRSFILGFCRVEAEMIFSQLKKVLEEG